tara:strand:+ start:827 stop:1027 length:201 start_codon:yes stop_codon:yes gene_type:complete
MSYQKKPKKVKKKKPIQKVVKKDVLQTTKCVGKSCYDKSDNLKVLESLAKDKKIKESDIFDMPKKK